MKRLAGIVLLSCLASSLYSQTLTDHQVIFGKKVSVEHSEIDNHYTRFTPTQNDIHSADSLSQLYIKHSRSKYPWADEIVGYENYYRQYVGYLNLNNEKTIFINVFCKSNPTWKNSLIMVNGGGSCYFNLKVDLYSQKAFNLNVNAP